MGRTALQNEVNVFLERYLKGVTLTASALSKARKKLKPNAFLAINVLINKDFYEQEPIKRWRRFRLLACDGSTLNLIDANTKCQRFFGIHDSSNGHGKTHSLARLSLFHDVLNNRILDASIRPDSIGEREMLVEHLEQVDEQQDLVILDRGYIGAEYYSAILKSGRDFLVRLPKSLLILKDLQNGDVDEKIVELDLKDGSKIDVRIVVVELDTGELEFLITSLTSTQLYPKEDFKELYYKRWPVEETFKALKCFLKLESITGTTQESVEQDFYSNVLFYNLTEAAVQESDKEVKKLKRVHDYKVCRTQAYLSLKRSFFELLEDNFDESYQALKRLFMTSLTCIRQGRAYVRDNDKDRRAKVKSRRSYR